MSVEELQEKWRPALYAASFAMVSYEGLLETADQLQAGEIDGWDAFGQLLAVGLILSSTKGLVDGWEPAPDQAGYKAALQDYVDGAGSIVKRWLDQEIDSSTVSGLIQDDYQASEELLHSIMQAMLDDGLSRDKIEDMLNDLAQRLEAIEE